MTAKTLVISSFDQLNSVCSELVASRLSWNDAAERVISAAIEFYYGAGSRQIGILNRLIQVGYELNKDAGARAMARLLTKQYGIPALVEWKLNDNGTVSQIPQLGKLVTGSVLPSLDDVQAKIKDSITDEAFRKGIKAPTSKPKLDDDAKLKKDFDSLMTRIANMATKVRDAGYAELGEYMQGESLIMSTRFKSELLKSTLNNGESNVQ